MWYELYLRPNESGEAELKALLSSLSLGPEETGDLEGRELVLKAGVIRVALHPPGSTLEGSLAVGGLDVRIPGEASAALATEALDAVMELAEKHQMSLYDPQLGRAVKRRDVDAVLARIRRMADYLTETVGLDQSAQARHIDVDLARPRLTLSARFYIALAIVLTLLAILAGYC